MKMTGALRFISGSRGQSNIDSESFVWLAIIGPRDTSFQDNDRKKNTLGFFLIFSLIVRSSDVVLQGCLLIISPFFLSQVFLKIIVTAGGKRYVC